MIGYFDTSAVIPLVVAEVGTARCADTWQRCDIRVSSLLLVVEAHAALAQALRLQRLTMPEHRAALKLLRRRIGEVDMVMPNREIVDRAATLSLDHALRGYDAVHAASALSLLAPDMVAISGDHTLLNAWAALGVATIDTGV